MLCDLARFYVKDEFEFNVRLILKEEEIPEVKLSMDPALSWTSWLKPMHTITPGTNGSANGHGPTAAREDPYIIITPEAMRSASGSHKSRLLYRLPRGKHAELLRLMKRNVAKNDVLMQQGKAATAMYIIQHGKVQLSRSEEHGR